MQHFSSLQDLELQGSWLTIGTFDGVHAGHRQIISKLTAGAHREGAPAVVLTFHPHPSMVLRGPQESYYLTTPLEKARLLGGLGVDVVITHPFNLMVRETPAADFMRQVKQHLGLRQLWVGHDFAMGHNRDGNQAALQQLSQELGFDLHVIEPVSLDGELVSSSRIRSLLHAGQVKLATQLLGRPHILTAYVIRGKESGRIPGLPTASLAVPTERLVPGQAVYVCRALLRDGSHGAVANIGPRPRVETEPYRPNVEVHLLDFDGDLYGEELQLEFLAHLREERQYADPAELRQQILADLDAARRVLTEE